MIFDDYLDGTLLKTLERRVRSYQSRNIDRTSAEEAAVTAFLRLRLRSVEGANGEGGATGGGRLLAERGPAKAVRVA